MNTSGIYKITNPRGLVYVGQTINFASRVLHYKKNNCKGQRKLYHSIKKYGWDTHKFEIIHICEKHMLNHWEVYYIYLLNSTDKITGLNLQGGGEYKLQASETKEKIKKSRKGMEPWNKGKKGLQVGWSKGKTNIYSETVLEKMRERMKGSKSPMEGKKHTEQSLLKMRTKRKKKLPPRKGTFSLESRKKMSLSRIGNKNSLGAVRSVETRRKISELKKGNKNCVGRVLSNETKRKISEAAKKRYELLKNK